VRTARDVREMDLDFRQAQADDAVKTWDIGFKHGRILGREQGAAVAFGLLGMAEAIRTRGLCRHGKERCWECFHPDE
jgi:hypothetical protein